MILFDTNLIIDALDGTSLHHEWAKREIAAAVAGGGAFINAVTVAELCAGDRKPEIVVPDLQRWGLGVLDVPAGAASVCGKAYRRYLSARRTSGVGSAPKTPLPDFFIGAHAEFMGWKLATRDTERIAKYFPSVKLVTP